jgi:Spy/CpxP family protein refolding chaperone
MRFSGKGWMLVAGLAVVAMVSQSAVAQDGGQGRRGRGGGGFMGGMMGPITAGRAIGAKEVQEALKLTDDQKTKIEKINDDSREAGRALFRQGGPPDMDKMVELSNDASKKIEESLEPEQQKRLVGILIQLNGPTAVADPGVAKELNITDDQKKTLHQIRQDARAEGEKMRDDNGSREDRQKKMQEIQDEVSKKILGALTSDQQAQLESLKGDKVEVDKSQLRGFGGPGGPGGGRDGDRGGRRGRRGGDNNSESKSGDSSN